MKKLMFAALIAGSVFAVTSDCFAQEAAPAAAAEAPAKKAKLTKAERAAQKKAKKEAAAVEIIKKYGLDEEKAKALYAELVAMMKANKGGKKAVE